MISLHTNISSIIAQQSLNTSTNRLNRAIEQMSTGFKINHAGDNAANYSISTNMSTQLNSYEVAQDNISMGMDMVNTANGALDEIQDRLSRLRALAEQAANGTYGEDSLAAINAEGRAIIDEISRVSSNTEYNGMKLFGETTAPDGSIVGLTADLTTNEKGFIKDIIQRDTSGMTSLASVSETETLAIGTYSISTAEELAKLAAMQNAGKITAGSEFVLANDIDLSGYDNWVGIGTSTQHFSGTFDGNGYEIKNMRVTSGYAGLFRYVENSIFKNIACVDCDINTTGAYSGGVVACNYGEITLDNCYTSGELCSTKYIGGICGNNASNSIINITNCYSVANITSSGSAAGGILSLSSRTSSLNINNCFYTGNVKTSSHSGGITGCIMTGCTGTITNCYTTGNITSNTSITCAAGGIVGAVFGCDLTIENCETDCNITGTIIAGGIVGTSDLVKADGGTMNLEIKNSFSNSTLSVTEENGVIGGVMTTWDDPSCNTLTNVYFNGFNSDAIGVVDDSVDNTNTLDNVVNLYSERQKTLQVGIYSYEESQIGCNTYFDAGALKGIKYSGLQSENTLEIIDKVLNEVTTKSTELGAAQNRLESALESTGVNIENLTKSRSTLRDADIGEVSSQFIRQQILQQAAATLMSTANQSPAIALQLI